MLGYLLVGTLAAFGALSALWALLGWLLPGGKGCVVICYGAPKPEILTRFKWLRSLGFLNCPVILVSDKVSMQWEQAENCTEEELLQRLKQEYERYHGTGTGDSSGRGQRCGISEL